MKTEILLNFGKIVNMKNKILLCCLLSLLGIGCMQEKGNYDYHPVNTVLIDSLETYYAVTQFESPDIIPYLSQTLGEGEENLEFLWTLTNGQEVDTLSRHRNLDEPIVVPPGRYFQTMYYVTDKNTGIFTSYNFTLDVNSALGEGLLVLSDLEGEANLTYIREGEVISDLEKQWGGIGKNPVGVYFHPKSYYGPAYISITCQDEQGGIVLDGVTMEKAMTYKDFYHVPVKTPRPMSYQNCYYSYRAQPNVIYMYIYDLYKEYFCDGNKIYERSMDGTADKFNAEMIASDTKGYRASPWLMTSGMGQVFVYDELNHRFLSQNNSYELEPVYTGSSGILDVHNLGENMTLVYADAGYTIGSNPYYYLIFTDRVKNYFVRLRIDRYDFVPLEKYEIDLPLTPETKWATHTMTPSLYYTVGEHEIYNFDADARTSVKRYDFGTGKKITCMWLEPCITGGNKYEETRIYVGISSEGGTRPGSVYVLRANNDNSLELIDSYEHIAGEIVGFAWKR